MAKDTKKEVKTKEIYTMTLHEEIGIKDTGIESLSVLRVSGGWIYTRRIVVQKKSENPIITINSVFVPVTGEFNK